MMNHSTICSWLRVLPALLLLCLSVVAQQLQDTTVSRELALAVSWGVDEPREIPAFKGGGGTFSPRRIESWKPSSKEATVNDVIFKIDREGEIVIAHLSVRLENEKQVMVGTYRLREGETIKPEELTKFGLEPLVLKVVKATPAFNDPSPPIMPKVVNKTKAVEVVGFYQEAAPSKDFRLTLRNVSSKNIIALDLFMPSADGNGGSGLQSRGDETHPVMLPDGISVHYISIPHGGRTTPDGFVPDVALQQTLIIRTVVFADGTYDGLVGPAAEMEAQRRGLDIQRRRILRLLREAKRTKDGELLTTFDELKEQAYALSKIADPSLALEVIARFPSLDEKSKGSFLEIVEDSLRAGKLELLRYIDDFEEMQKQPGEHITFAEWLKQTTARYEKLTTTL